jgi:DNA-binding Lrp family transcriptional regulator
MHRPNLDIAFLYSENARAKIKDIAQVLKKSSQRVKYNIDVLEKESIVQLPHALLDHSYLGLLLFRVYFQGGYISEEDKTEIIRKMKENQYVTSVYEMGSGYDLVVELISPNPSRFNKEIKKLTSYVPSLNTYTAVLNIVTHVYPRLFISGVPVDVPKEIIIGGDRVIENFTETERSVLRCLIEDPKQGLSTLAKKAGIHQKTVNATLRSLKIKKILKGYKFVLNSKKLGIRKFRLFISLHNISQEREDKLINFCLRTEEVVQLNKTIGDWDIEIDIAGFSEERIRQVTMRMRQDFKDLIQSFDVVEVYSFHKKSYLPMFIWSDRPKDMREPRTKTPVL